MSKQKTEVEEMESALEAFGAGLMLLFDEQNGLKKTDDEASPISGYVYNE